MYELIAFGWAWVVVCEAFLLVLGVVNLVTYRSNIPESAQSFAAVRSSENDFRSIVAPAIAALITGGLVSVSATFAYDALTGKGEANFLASFVCLMVALVVLILLLQPLMRGELTTEKLAQHPQRIYLATESIRGTEEDASAQIAQLRVALENWKERSGAYSMGWPARTESPLLNTTMAAVPANEGLRFADAIRSVEWRGVVKGALRTAPWRFGWPLFVLPVPLLTVAVGSFITGWPPIPPGWAIVIIVTGIIAITLYWVGAILVAARRLAIARAFVLKCDAAFVRSETRARTEASRQSTIDTIPDQLQAIVDNAKRVQMWAAVGAAIGLASASSAMLRAMKRR